MQMHLAYRVYADAPRLHGLCRSGAMKEKRETMPWGDYTARQFEVRPTFHCSNAAA